MENFKNISNEEIAAEVSSDLARMFAEQANMSEEYTYGRMTLKEFIASRREYKRLGDANITGWNGWDNAPYAHILIGRILKKTGYKINQPVYMLNLTSEDRTRIDEVIKSAVSLYLDVTEATA